MKELKSFTYLLREASDKDDSISSGMLKHRLKVFLTIIFSLLLLNTHLPAAKSKDFDTYYDDACLNFRRSKYEEALKSYKKANKLRENSSLECLWGMARAYGKLGAAKNVIKTCDKLIQIGSDEIIYTSKAWKLRGDALYALATKKSKPDKKKLTEAETAYKEALKINPRLNWAHYDLGITLITLQRVEEGVRELRIFEKSAGEADAEAARKIIENPRRAVEDFAPDFSVVTVDGEYIDSEELLDKIVLLDFWGAWCKPCVSALPFLSGLYKKYDEEEEFVLLSVDVNDEEAKWLQFIEENKMHWPQVRDGDRKMQRTFKVTAFPTYILIDHEGIIRYRGKGSGYSTEDQVKGAIKKALKAAKAEPVADSRSFDPPEQTDNTIADIALPITESELPDTKLYAVRIPKPSLTVEKSSNPTVPSANRRQSYILQIQNWASFPDDLFETSWELPPCKGFIVYQDQSVSTRLGLTVLSEQGQTITSACNMVRPEMLQRIFFALSAQYQIDKVYVQIEDRLTGNVVQSDLITIPH